MAKPDFTQRRWFPGTHGNPFDRLMDVAHRLEHLPAPLFAALLLVIAGLPTAFSLAPSLSFLLWLFFLGDWALLAALPRARISFGPARPSTLLLAVMRLPALILPAPFAVTLQAIGTALVVYGFWVEPQRMTVTHERLTSPKLKAGLPPLRVLHLGDLHVERKTEREAQLLRLVKDLAPDLILFSGDFLNISYLDDKTAWNDCRAILRALSARLGVFAVSGSPAVDLPDLVPQLLEEVPNVRWLNDERVSLRHRGQPIDLVGVSCTHKPFVDGPKLSEVLNHEPPPLPHFTILIHHTPDLAPEAAEAGVDLQLSGHTHGGQVRLPMYGALYAASLYGKRFEAGRRQVGDLTLYVTRGIGLEGKSAPRVRFLCPPEIILWEISG